MSKDYLRNNIVPETNPDGIGSEAHCAPNVFFDACQYLMLPLARENDGGNNRGSENEDEHEIENV